MASTRSKTRLRQQSAAERAEESTIADSGLLTGGAPASPSTVRRRAAASDTPAPLIPVTGGRTIDHSATVFGTSESPPPPATGGRAPVRPPTRAPSVSSHSTQASRAAARLRKEYEAEKELAEIQRSLVRKRLELDLAEIEATSADEAEDRVPKKTEDSIRIVEAWMEKAPPATIAPVPASNPAGGLRDQGETYEDARTPLLPRTHPDTSTRRERSIDRGRGMAELAEAITRLARPRPVPRQAFELPIFDGNVSEWRVFKNSYEATATTYEYKNYENLARLRVAIQGKARKAVMHLLAANSKPEIIMKTLESIYGRPDCIIKDILQQIRSLPRVTDNDRSICEFAATARNCVAVLQDVDTSGQVYNPILVEELYEKLSPLMKYRYCDYVAKNSDGNRPRLITLVEFLEEEVRVNAMRPIAVSVAATRPSDRAPRPREVHRVNTQCESVACPKCAAGHKLNACAEYKSLTTDEKWDFVKKNKMCFKCIVKSHQRANCRGKGCAKCGRGHHTSLHVDYAPERRAPDTARPATSRRADHAHERPAADATRSTAAADSAPAREPQEVVTSIGSGGSRVLLKIMPVLIKNGDYEVKVHALLDDGATVTLLDSSVAETVNVDGPKAVLRLVSARGQQITDRKSKCVKVCVRGPNGVDHELRCRTIERLDLPTQSLPAHDIERYRHLRGCQLEALADARPLLLIGQDNWELITSCDIRRGKSGEPAVSLTNLGWVAHGRRGRPHIEPAIVNCLADVELAIQEHFDLDSLGISERERVCTDVKRANRILNDSTRYVGGRWETGLLWKNDETVFPDNYNAAKKRLVNIENKMDRDPDFAAAYTAQIEKLIESQYAVKVENVLETRNCFFLPHFAVVNPNKPGKIRVVFDAAAKFQGKSLNDYLLTGPDLLNNLVGILFRFRIGQIAVTGDIQDMFLRVKVRVQDQKGQLFLWRGAERHREPVVYAMTSLIFGAASSPTSAIYVLNKNAESHAEEFPNVLTATKRDHYMDDLLHSTDSVDGAARLISDVTEVHARGGFVIRGWATNARELETRLPSASRAAAGPTVLHKTKTERTLGLIWYSERDELGFDLTFKKLPSEIVNGTRVPTKRQFLSLIMSVFDPLGLLCPVTVKSKILMQRIWRSQIGWDDQLLENDYRTWLDWLNEIRKLTDLKVPRWYSLLSSEVQLHVFGDASEHAYAAAAYWRAERPDGSIRVVLVAGKTRVTPNKVISIPRLELQAALLACRLAATVQREHGISITKRVLWSDSKTVLKWLRSDPRSYKPFVAHRLAELDERSNISEWRWVNSADNPADDATRANTSDLTRWLNGPDFLMKSEQAWPVDKEINVNLENDNELRVESVNVLDTPRPDDVIDIARFSSWTRLVRALAQALRFIKILKKQAGPLGADDLLEAERLLFVHSQKRAFAAEIQAAEQGDPLPRGSPLRALDVVTADGLLRVGGRLRRAPALDFDEKHPIILHGRDPATRLLVDYYHRRAGHANNEAVVNTIRERFWIVKLRPTVKHAAASCRLCRVRRARPDTPKMADLPVGRLAFRERPFSHTGLDYFGPIEVTIGRRREKRWAALFTCLTTRAVHIELASSLSADSMIMALRRFMARRGQPATIHSDHGTNFVGAASELERARREIEDELQREATARTIRWVRIPPNAPHMGGSWERLVRSIKTALTATLHTRAPKEEVLYTLLLEAEFVVNSRPLTHVSVSADDPTALTPNHFLLGSATGRCAMGRFDVTDVYSRKQWRASQALADMFWQRWLREYLPTLQQRHKWTQAVQPIRLGDVVIVTDPQLPRNSWPRGIVEKLYPGSDGQVRVVDIRTASGKLRRPTARLAVLPTEEESSTSPTGGGLLTAENEAENEAT